MIQRARENDPEIVSRFAWYYFNQNRRSKKAFAWFNKGATHNHNEAQYQVGYMYKKGLGVNQDNKLAMEWYKKAASNGHNKAQYKIGKMYRYGDGTYRNYKQAEEWYKKAANNGNVDAMYDLGYLYRYGATLVHKDIHSAIKWYTKAAEHEHVVAQYHLGEIYELDKEVKNLQMAINWYHKARFLNPHVKSKIRTLNKQGYYPRGEQKGTIYSCFFFFSDLCFMMMNTNMKHSFRRQARKANKIS